MSAMDAGMLIDQLDHHGRALADVAERAGLDAPVPTCPDWSVDDLLGHVGTVHRWAIAHLRAGDPTGGGQPEFEHAPPGQVLDWFRHGHAELVATLRTTPADAPAWAFLAGAPKTATFWARRQAHETAMHRADAESALGTRPDFDPGFALDGIAELLEGFYARRGGTLFADPAVSLRVAPSDAETSWLVVVHPDRREISRAATGAADCTVAGTCADLYRWLWNRAEDDAVRVEGDGGVVALWRAKARISWR